MTENGSINERRGLNVNQHLFKNGFDLNMGRVRKSNIHLIFISVEKKNWDTNHRFVAFSGCILEFHSNCPHSSMWAMSKCLKNAN